MWDNMADKSLFIGCSHTMGYYFHPEKKEVVDWQENNYAEIYSNKFNEDIIIYAMPGAANNKYVKWINHVIQNHPDITKIFIQSTYFGRFLMAYSKDDTMYHEIPHSGFVYPIPSPNPKITRYTDQPVHDTGLEINAKNTNIKPCRILTIDPSNLPSHWEPYVDEYMHTRFWFETNTHLTYVQYCTDLFAIDYLCYLNNIECFLYSLNSRASIPNDINYFGPFKILKKVDISIEDFIKTKYNINISDETIDNEHYNYNVHKIVGEEFIPFIKEEYGR